MGALSTMGTSFYESSAELLLEGQGTLISVGNILVQIYHDLLCCFDIKL